MKHFSKFIAVLTLFPATIIISQPTAHNGESDSPFYTIETQFRALWFKPNTNNSYYAAEAFPFNESIPVPVASPNWAIFDLHPSYHFGFDVGLRTTFHAKKTNFSLNWQHFKSSTNASHQATGNNMIGPFSSIGPDQELYKFAHGRVKFDFNEVNARYGHSLECGTNLRLNLAAGISWAHIGQHLTTVYSNGSNISRTIKIPSTFRGVGPQCTLDFTSSIVKGLSITGQISTALLAGTVENQTCFSSISPDITNLGNPSPNIQRTSAQNRFQIIPSFQEHLGLVYSFDCYNRCAIALEAGYEAKIFLNAIQSTDLNSGAINVTPNSSTVGVFARTFDRHLSNFALGGPYVAGSISF